MDLQYLKSMIPVFCLCRINLFTRVTMSIAVQVWTISSQRPKSVPFFSQKHLWKKFLKQERASHLPDQLGQTLHKK